MSFVRVLLGVLLILSAEIGLPSEASETLRQKLAILCATAGSQQQCYDGALKQVENDALTLVRIWTEGCTEGVARNCAHIGWMQANGSGTAHDASAAVRNFERGCELGSPLACADLGYMLKGGYGTERDVERAVGLYERSCEAGSGLGCHNFAATFGSVLPSDPVAKASYFERGCDLGHATSCLRYSEALEHGYGAQKDKARADQKLRKSCDLGSREACSRIAE